MMATFPMVYACKNPDYVFSLIFKYDSEYLVDLSLFETIGEDGINYIKESTNDTNIITNSMKSAYSYRSHYNDFVLIQVGAAGINFIIDTSGLNIDSFKADSCIIKELDWLNRTGIVQISRVDREEIAAAFANDFKSSIYWVKWNVFTNSDMVADSSGNFRRARCASNFSIIFPSERLEITSIINKNRFGISEKTSIRNLDNSKSALVDIRGRKIKNISNLKKNSVSSNLIIHYDQKNGTTKRLLNLN